MEVRHVQHVQTQMDTLHLKRSLLTLTQSKESPKCCKVILDLQIDPHVFFFRTFWISMHFAPVPLLPSLPRSRNCTLWRSGARGLPLRPFLEDTQGSTAGRKIVEFPRL